MRGDGSLVCFSYGQLDKRTRMMRESNSKAVAYPCRLPPEAEYDTGTSHTWVVSS